MQKYNFNDEIKKAEGDYSKLPSGKYIEHMKNGRRRVFTINNEPTMTDQSQQDDTDVNIVVSRFMKGGPDPFRNFHGHMADVSEAGDLHESFQQVEAAQRAFDSLPAELREKFGNSPVSLVNFLSNPQNRDQAISLGLIEMPVNLAPSDNSGETKRQRGSSSLKSTSTKSKNAPNDDESNDDE